MDNKLNLIDLVGKDMLQQIQDAFSEMTGIAALTADKDGISVTDGSNFTDFCQKFTRQSELGRSRCEECDKMGAHLTIERGQSCAYYCHAGLVDFAAPIIVEGEMVGSFIGGQVLPEPPDLEKFARVADELGIDKKEYLEAVKKVKIVDKAFIDKAAHGLQVIANALSTLAFNGYKLHQSNIEIEKAARAKSDFLANMSHEIRTPMNAVLGLAEMALREEMSPAARECIHQIRFSGKNLLTIINDILDFSKIESGKMDIVPVTYEPLSMVNDLSSIICNRIGDKDVEFILDIPPDMPEKLIGDNVRIQQILVNLLNNAVKFTKCGEVRLKIVCEKINDDTIMLNAHISDTGSGIKPEDMQKLFKSFQQVDSKRNRNIEGTGLGLAISKQLLELMDGTIFVKSEYNKGSTFTFRLPQKVVSKGILPSVDNPVSVALLVENKYVKAQIINDLKKVDIPYTDIESVQSFDNRKFDYFILDSILYSERLQDYFEKNPSMKCIAIEPFDKKTDIDIPRARIIRKPVYYLNLYAALGIINEYSRENDNYADDFTFTAPEAQILIVDDNSVNLIVAKGLLEPLKMQIDTADSAASAIEKIKEKTYDLIFMDHMMPEVDGVEATHIIRRLVPSYENVPIIALTANALEGTREMFIKEGMNDFVAKPIDMGEITAMLAKWLPQEKIIPVDKSAIDAKKPAEPTLKIKELNVEGALSLLGSENLFRTVLREYFTSIEKKADSIEEHYNNENWKSYTIEVHALKSASRQIGADELADLAAELERAGNAKNTALIKEKTGKMLEMYRGFADILRPHFPECMEHSAKKPADPMEVRHLLDDLCAALADFDTLMIDEVVEKLGEYEFDNEFFQFYTELKAAAEDSDIDRCGEIAEEWKADIAGLYIDNI